MFIGEFESKREILDNQYEDINWIKDSGVEYDTLAAECLKLEESLCDFSKNIIKANTFRYIMRNAQIAIDKDDIFQDKLNGRNIMADQRTRWLRDIYSKHFEKITIERTEAVQSGAYEAMPDFGHVSPNSRDLIDLGLTGLIKRIETTKKNTTSKKQDEFYESCLIMLNAIIDFIKRIATAIKPYNYENYLCLKNISEGRPKNIYESLQLLIIYFTSHEFIAGGRIRTLGRLDVLLYPFYVDDIKSGTYTKAEIKQMLKYFLNKLWAAKVPYDQPFMLGGIDKNGNEVTNELSYLIVETYDELNIYSPKIHIRVSDKTPDDFIKRVLECIRKGNSSFLIVNDDIAIKSLQKTGVTLEDARDYVLIGCYEPAVWGLELPCTGNGYINLAKSIEFVLCGGTDIKSGKKIGIECEMPQNFDELKKLLKQQIKFITEKAMFIISEIEKYYMEIYPDPLLSSMVDCCVEKGVDIYDGGAKYNNSSLNFIGLATFVDSIVMIKELVFDKKVLTLEKLKTILINNWKGNEKLRLIANNLKNKYGNENAESDAVLKEFAQYSASIINNKPNGRGGVFKAGLFSIDMCFNYGSNTMAMPCGRLNGEPLSKNLCAVTSQDKSGVTALINSVTKLDFTCFPNGSVLDIMLHPSAVEGDDGLNAMLGILLAYFSQGGFAMHGNVFDADLLKDAQLHPEKYESLQVRVCGWNAFFVNLTEQEQNEFIKQAENLGYTDTGEI